MEKLSYQNIRALGRLVGDFNRHSPMWEYYLNDSSRDTIMNWITLNSMELKYNVKKNWDISFSQMKKGLLSGSLPALINYGFQNPIIKYIPKLLWNFKLANNKEDRSKACVTKRLQRIVHIRMGYGIAPIDNKKKRWQETTENLNFIRSSRKTWALLKNLGSNDVRNTMPGMVTLNDVASRLVRVGKIEMDKSHTREVKWKLRKKIQILEVNEEYSTPFSQLEI
ncbi:Hypothetical protein CINCED_3A006499 [Cinara cedri]|uniref:Uncharacterized protein n=1 Tax=Cinara cedri TaxID=506608 RepID=A0A5E4LWR4_9HEMI|nr:Hypothetical protein CINCED_3A006499 [Cinara cedri]